MLTKDAAKELLGEVEGPDLDAEISLGEMVEAYTGQTLAERVEESIGLAEGPPRRQVKKKVQEKTFTTMAITASDLLRYVRIPGTCLGFHQLVTAIDLAVEDENRLLNVIDDLYPLVGEVYHATANSVQKNMRMAIISGWKNGGGKQLEKLTGLPYPARPVTKDFIDTLADYLRKRMG